MILPSTTSTILPTSRSVLTMLLTVFLSVFYTVVFFKGVDDQGIGSLNTLFVCQIHKNSHDTSFQFFNYSANIMFTINLAPHCVPQCILHSCAFKGVDDQRIGSLNTLSVCQIHQNSHDTSFHYFNYSANIMFRINRAPHCVPQCILHSCSFKGVDDQRIGSLNTLSVCQIHQNSHDTSSLLQLFCQHHVPY